MRRTLVFPFTAIVGQERAKLALILNAINPLIGGVLLRGDRGTGKSTMVRAFAQVLPEIEVVADCPFNCNPYNVNEMCDSCYERYMRGEKLPIEKRRMKVVELPLNATIDRVVGTLDIRRAIKEGIKALEPGILAEANRNILYIDEVNLLDDYIVDVLLDAAAFGWNIVEREGISVKHPSRFILVGSMNPEEGELRPQILDRFGLVVEVEAITDPDLRCEIVKRVEEFHCDPESFVKKYEHEEVRLRERIRRAREIVSKVAMEDELVKLVAKVCVELHVSTHRAEIITVKCAKALAAFDGRTRVELSDVKKALELVLPHRLKKSPFDESQEVRELLESLDIKFRKNQYRGQYEKFRVDRQSTSHHSQGRGEWSVSLGELLRQHHPVMVITTMPFYRDIPTPPQYHAPLDRIFKVRKDFDITSNIYPRIKQQRVGSRVGHRASRRSYIKKVGGKMGVYITYMVPKDVKKVDDIAVDATIRAAVLRMIGWKVKAPPIKVSDEDIRERVRRRPVSHLIILILDSSGSMAALRRIELAKGILWNLAKRAYIDKDYVSLIVFRRNHAKILVEPTRNYKRVMLELERVPTGGKTPLSHALLEAYRLIKREKIKNKDLQVSLIIVTDGKANVPLNPSGSIEEEIRRLGTAIRKLGVRSLIVDTRLPFEVNLALDYMNELVEALNARCVRVPVIGA
ncbi:MAG: magnesium chelatase [Thermoprotei archaeon]|nr:MAG: magnesium chelatase [Thermoprotei archaeon]